MSGGVPAGSLLLDDLPAPPGRLQRCSSRNLSFPLNTMERINFIEVKENLKSQLILRSRLENQKPYTVFQYRARK